VLQVLMRLVLVVLLVLKVLRCREECMRSGIRPWLRSKGLRC